jgi:tetratricopeptide (TPR) repeat protein
LIFVVSAETAYSVTPLGCTAKGLIFYEQGLYKEAINEFTRAISLSPNFTAAYSGRGATYSALGQHERAIQDFSKVIELEPNPAEVCEAYSNRGLTYHRLGLYETAIRDFSKAIELNPSHVYAYYNRGAAYSAVGQYEKAIRDFSKAIELNPKFDMAYCGRGIVYGARELYEKAIQDFNKAIDVNPDLAEAYYNRGLAYKQYSGQYKKAVQDFNKTIELNSKYADAYYNRGDIYGALQQHEKAIQDFSKAIELNHSDYYAYFKRGFTYQIIGQDEKAIEDFNKMLEMAPHDSIEYLYAENQLKSLRQTPATQPSPSPQTATEEPEQPPIPLWLIVLLILVLLIVPAVIWRKRSVEIIIERTIYDPCKRDFIEKSLPRIKEWINRYDPGAYWFAISIQNNTDKAIEEWGVELETSSALKIKETKIEGIEIEIPHEARLNTFNISVPKEYGIAIPKGGAQRVYFKLRAEKPKTTYEINGVFKSAITGDVPIRAKEFKYLCDADMPPEAVKAELKKTFSEKDLVRLALSFKTVQELDRMCNQDAKSEKFLDKLLALKNYTEGFSDTFTKQLDEFSRFMREEQLGYLDDEYKGKMRRFCTNLVDVWINEFLR